MTKQGMPSDLKLIPEYDGKTDIVEWIDKLELVCSIRGISDTALVTPLRLRGGAFAVYQQLADKEKKSEENIKTDLTTAFAADPYTAYEEFTHRKLVRVSR